MKWNVRKCAPVAGVASLVSGVASPRAVAPALIACIVSFVGVAADAGVADLASASIASDRQQPAVFTQTVCRDVTLRHLVYLPDGYEGDSTRDWPLILFLHGSGERGNELDRVKVNGLPKELDAGREIPAIVLSPQCPAGARWETELMVEALNALLDDAVARYRVDPNRVYVTGLSMGGFGTWALAAAYPERFAAVAPVCGGGSPDLAIRMRRLPIWAFHGVKDDIVAVAATEQMADAMARVHGDMRTTYYPDAGHDAWSETYSNPELYTWLLGHAKQKPRLIPLDRSIATASSGDPAKAIDGDLATRWESEWSDPQWLELDLGAPTALGRMVLYWETAHCKVYDVLASGDGARDWQTIATVTDGDGVVDIVDFPPGLSARFLRLAMKTRGTQWGDSIWEIELESAAVNAGGAVAPPGLPPLIRYGGMREALGQGHDEARVRLADLIVQGHVYAVGALEGIAGEITILDSFAYVTSAGTGGDGLVPLGSSSLSATMLAGQSVAAWADDLVEVPIPLTGFDTAIHDAATAHGLDPSTPFAFLVQGTLTDVRLHVIHGACPVHARMHGLELAEDERPYEREVPRIEGTVVGIYAEGAVGDLTHPDTHVHAHLVFIDPETGRTVTGHLEQVGVAAGSVVRVPRVTQAH